MTRYVAITVDKNGEPDGMEAAAFLCPADAGDWARKYINDKQDVAVFEYYGTFYVEQSPLKFAPAKGAEPPGKLPEPPLSEGKNSATHISWDAEGNRVVTPLGTAKTGG